MERRDRILQEGQQAVVLGPHVVEESVLPASP
jgi:hypothetical protein